MRCYPSPSNGIMNVESASSDQIIEVMLYDMQGRLTDSIRGNNATRTSWNPNVVTGAYQVVIETQQGRYTAKWVKQD